MVVAAFSVSCVALVFSAVALVFTGRADRRAVRAERRGRVVWSHLETVSHSRCWKLTNEGTATAYGVTVAPGPFEVRPSLRKSWGNNPPPLVRLEGPNNRDFPAKHAEAYQVIEPSNGHGQIGSIDRLVITWYHRPDRTDPQERIELLLLP